VRESIAYLRDPDGFIAERHQQFGPVFGTTLFFRPTAVVGGPEAVDQFTRLERNISESALPAAFTALHTPDGALNQAGEKHRFTRRGYSSLFSPNNLESYLPAINRCMVRFASNIAERGTTCIALDAKHLCLNLFAELFAGESLTTDEIHAFISYNDALLSLSKQLPSFKRGEKALAELQQGMQVRLAKHRRRELNGTCFSIFIDNLDEKGQPWSDERIATATVLMVWGAYIEVASLMASCLIQTRQRLDVRERILKEAFDHNLEQQATSGDLAAWDLPFVQGVLRESLRLMPPAGGGSVLHLKILRFLDIAFLQAQSSRLIHESETRCLHCFLSRSRLFQNVGCAQQNKVITAHRLTDALLLAVPFVYPRRLGFLVGSDCTVAQVCL
jgi:cytochrome P450